MSLSAKFQELENLLLHQYHLIGLHSGVPFILLIYPPSQERLCQAHQIDLVEKLRARGVPVVEHKLNTFIFDYYTKRGRLEQIFELDREKPEELRRMMAGVYGQELVKRILDTADQADPDGVIFLSGVANIYPFARVSSLLAKLENQIKLPLVVFYPGSERDGRLSFLDIEPHVGYRARNI